MIRNGLADVNAVGQQEPESLPAEKPLPSEEYVEKACPPILTVMDMTAMFVVVLFFITNVSSAVAGGASGLTLWLVGLLFFIPCSIATAQLGVLFPHEGSLYIWTHKAFGGFMSFFVGFCAWVPSSLIILATADLVVSYLQNLNANWLVAPWSQGVVLLVIIILACGISLQRQRTVQNLVNMAFLLSMFAAVLVFIAGIVWLFARHPSASSFSQVSDWNPFTAANLPLFGVITLGYLGVNLPMNLGGEIARTTPRATRRIITGHLLWGTLIVLACYLLATFGVLVVQGANAGFNLFSLVTTVSTSLGPFMGDVTAVCIMATLVVAAMVYTSVYARFLFVAGIDGRLPNVMGKLNSNRVPANAIIFQAGAAGALTILFFMIIPYIGIVMGKPSDVATEVYWVGVGVGTLLWAFGTIFLFIDLLRLYFRDPEAFRPHRLFPTPILLLSSAIGLIAGLAAMIDSIVNSYDPQLIPNGTWWYVIVGTTVILMVLGAIVGMLASSEASWQGMDSQAAR